MSSDANSFPPPEVKGMDLGAIDEPVLNQKGSDLPLIDLEKLAQAFSTLSTARDEEKKVERDAMIDGRRHRNEMLRVFNEGYKQDIGERKTYADKIFVFVMRWMKGIFLMLMLQGFLAKSDSYATFNFGIFQLHWKWHFELSEPIILAMIGGTTASVIGLFIIVA